MSPQCHIYASVNRVSIGSDNGLSPTRHQAIIQTSADLLPIGPTGTNFSDILIKMEKFSFTTMHLNLSSTKWQSFCPGVEKLKCFVRDIFYTVIKQFISASCCTEPTMSSLSPNMCPLHYPKLSIFYNRLVTVDIRYLPFYPQGKWHAKHTRVYYKKQNKCKYWFHVDVNKDVIAYVEHHNAVVLSATNGEFGSLSHGCLHNESIMTAALYRWKL